MIYDYGAIAISNIFSTLITALMILVIVLVIIFLFIKYAVENVYKKETLITLFKLGKIRELAKKHNIDLVEEHKHWIELETLMRKSKARKTFEGKIESELEEELGFKLSNPKKKKWIVIWKI